MAKMGVRKVKDKSNSNNDNAISIKYVEFIEKLPVVDLAADDNHQVNNIDWNWVAKNMIEHNKSSNSQDVPKEELIQEYVIDGKPFTYSIYVNTFRPCIKCGENVGGRPIVHIIFAKDNILMQTSGEKLHTIKMHGDSFSDVELEILKKILKI